MHCQGQYKTFAFLAFEVKEQGPVHQVNVLGVSCLSVTRGGTNPSYRGPPNCDYASTNATRPLRNKKPEVQSPRVPDAASALDIALRHRKQRIRSQRMQGVDSLGS